MDSFLGFSKGRKAFRTFAAAALLSLSVFALSSCSNLFDSPSGSENQSKLLILQNFISKSGTEASSAKPLSYATITGTVSLPEGAYPASVIAAINAAQKSLASSDATVSIPSSSVDGTPGNFAPAEISKSATASVPSDITNLEVYTYHATATNKTTGEEIKTSDADFSLVNGNVTFSMTIPYGTWLLETTIKDSTNTVIYKSAKIEKTFSAEDSVFRADFTLKPVQTTDGSGKVFLHMNVPSSVNAVTVQLVNGDESGWPSGYFTSGVKSLTLYGTQKKATIGNVTDNGTSVSTSAMTVKSGTYRVKLNFYDSSDTENRNLLYSVFQLINIYDGLTTNEWSEPATNSISAIKSDGTFEVTQELIEMSALTNFYVDGTKGDDSNPGSFYAPAKTLSKVINTISAVGLSDKDYTINIVGTVTPKTGTTTTELPATLNTKLNSLTIQGTTGSATDILDGQKKGTVLTIATSKPVTIKNLKITNGEAENGGGVNIGSGAKVSIVDSAIDENTATRYGGGIYNEGTVFLSGSTIIGKTGTEIATTTSGNIAKESGAGIYNKTGGKLYLGYEIDGEKSELSGGVCRNFLQNYTNSTALGGGVYNGGNVYFHTGNISYNFAYNGAGIYAYGNVEMTGGTIEGNEGSAGNDAGGGGGVFVGDGKSFTMSGNAQIKNNKNMAHGAGVYLNYNGCYLVMNGGTVSGNIAKTNGGAVYIHDMGAADYQHGHLQMSGDAVIPYGGSEKMNDVFFLDTNCTIEVTDNLTQNGSTTAVIPKTYSTGTKILTGTEAALDSAVTRFSVVNPESAEETLYIHGNGTLGPIIFFPNGTAAGTSEKDSVDYEVFKYSYIDYDDLSISVVNPYQDSTMEFTIDGIEKNPEEITTLSDGYHTLTLKITKDGAVVVDIMKYVYVRIIQVRAVVTNGKIDIGSGNTKYKGKLMLWAHGENPRTLREWGSNEDWGNPYFNTYSFTLYLDAKDSLVRYHTESSYAGHDSLHDVERDFSLKNIKDGGKHITIDSNTYPRGGNGDRTIHELWFELYNNE